MKYFIFCLINLLTVLQLKAQETYIVYDRNGKEVSLEDIIKLAKDKPLIFFGELHDQSFAHQAEYDLLTGLFERYKQKVVIGMEMFEADVQPIIDEYFLSSINQKSFESESRIWKNYIEDYKPLVEFAKEHQLKLIATNVPRRYANTVYHQGMETLNHLSPYAKQFFPSLPIHVDTTLQIYKEMLDMMPGHSNDNIIYSQALKDATMAHFIQLNNNSGSVFLHINGSYHSKNKQGILTYLNGFPIQKTITINSELAKKEGENRDYSTSDFTIEPKTTPF